MTTPISVQNQFGVFQDSILQYANETLDCHGHQLSINLSNEEAFCYVLGVINGDGSAFKAKENHWFVRLNVTDRLFAESFKVALEILGLNPVVYKSNYHNGWSKKEQYRVQAYSKTLVQLSRSLGPTQLFNLLSNNFKNSLAFVKGFYESEGSIFFNGPYSLGLTMYNKELEKLRLIDLLLLEANFHWSLRFERNRLWILRLLGGRSEVFRFVHLLQPCIKNLPRGGFD